MKYRLTIAIAAFGLLTLATNASAQSEGQTVFESIGCIACHYTEGPAREKTIADQLTKTGPELWYAGDKFQGDWLVSWLAAPKVIRPLKYNSMTEDNPDDHPALNPNDAASVGEYLMSLTSGEVEAGTVKVKKNAKGRQIFNKKMPCSGCHEFAGRKGKISGGRTGPSLVEAGVRLNPDWILAYLQKPKLFKPIKMMPVFVGLLSDKDMANVASYVANFKPKK